MQLPYIHRIHASLPCIGKAVKEKTTFPNEKVAVPLGNTRFLH
jgi:hypothetical protein